LQSHEDEEDCKEGEDTLGRPEGPIDQPRHGKKDSETDPQDGHEDTSVHEHLHGKIGEGGHQVELEVDELAQGVVGLAAVAFLVGHLDLRQSLGKYRRQSRDEGGMLVTFPHPFHHGAAVRPEHASPVRHVDAGDAPRHDVDKPRGPEAKGRILAAAPDRPDDVVAAFFHLRHQAGDLFRGILEIRIEGDDNLAPDQGKPRHNGGMLAVVPGEFHYPQPADLTGQALEDFQGTVPAAVIDHDDLVRPPYGPQHRNQAPGQGLQVLLLVVNGDNHRYENRFNCAHRCLVPANIFGREDFLPHCQ